MSSDLTCKVTLLRSKNLNVMISAIAGIVAAFFVTALLPSLLVRYLYAGQQLLQVPPFIEYLQVASFVLGAGYFLYAVVGNLLRAKRINYLIKKMDLGDACCDSTESKILAEMKVLSETLIKGSKKSKAKKSSSKKKKSKSKSKK